MTEYDQLYEKVTKRSPPRPDVLLQKLKAVEIERDAWKEKCEQRERERDEMASMLAMETVPDPETLTGKIYAYLMQCPDATNDEMFSVFGIRKKSPRYNTAIASAAAIRSLMFGYRNRHHYHRQVKCSREEVFKFLDEKGGASLSEIYRQFHLEIGERGSIRTWACLWRREHGI